MNWARKLAEGWRALRYRWQGSRRCDQGIYRTTAASRRNCGHCLRGARDPAGRYPSCQTKRLLVHRYDTCKRFVLRVDDE